MTDYEMFFKSSVVSARDHNCGVMSSSMFKMTLAENGKDVHVIYKEDSDKKGWLPRPVLPLKTNAWNTQFKTDKTMFAPTKILNYRFIKVTFVIALLQI